MSRAYSKGIVFDLDGTLVDTAPDLIEQLEIVLSGMGLELDKENLRNFIGGGARPLIERGLESASSRFGPEALDRIEADFIARYSEHCTKLSKPFPDVIKVLEQLVLDSDGLALFVCSNKRQDLAMKVLSGLGLSRFFLKIVGRKASCRPKPDKAALDEVLAASHLTPRQLIMVGDSATDIAFARACGMKVIGVSFGYSAKPIRTLGADDVIDHFRNLPQALENLW